MSLRGLFDPMRVPVLSEHDRKLMEQMYEVEKAGRNRILSTKPHSVERRNAMAEMYTEIFRLMPENSDRNRVVSRSRDAEKIVELCRPQRILEIGAGNGQLSVALAELGCSVQAIDLVADSRWEQIPNVCFRTGEFLDMEFSEKFDLIIMDNVLEHIPPGDFELTIRRVYDLLCPDGRFLAYVPNPITGPHDSTQYFIERGQPAQGAHFNEKRFRDLRRILSGFGFRSFHTSLFRYTGIRVLPWSPIWCITASSAERLCEFFPAKWRSNPFFGIFNGFVPRMIVAKK